MNINKNSNQNLNLAPPHNIKSKLFMISNNNDISNVNTNQANNLYDKSCASTSSASSSLPDEELDDNESATINNENKKPASTYKIKQNVMQIKGIKKTSEYCKRKLFYIYLTKNKLFKPI